MTKEELDAFREKLVELTENGSEGEVREYVEHYYPRLPEEERRALLFNTLFDAIREEHAISEIQEKGLEAADSLEQLKRKIEREKLTE
ncbi:hypothetical protein C4556_00125 [Candidatus Parcubacteria bacterium]|nr:MAG: hypothetical protein C4556_00125 [Candidatus Parcubacteria bacterium]